MSNQLFLNFYPKKKGQELILSQQAFARDTAPLTIAYFQHLMQEVSYV
jgi:hypothetical protein